jgi:hypothetical protein
VQAGVAAALEIEGEYYDDLAANSQAALAGPIRRRSWCARRGSGVVDHRSHSRGGGRDRLVDAISHIPTKLVRHRASTWRSNCGPGRWARCRHGISGGRRALEAVAATRRGAGRRELGRLASSRRRGASSVYVGPPLPAARRGLGANEPAAARFGWPLVPSARLIWRC